MRSIADKRKTFMKYLETLKIIDPSGVNYNMYRQKFEAMSDQEFDKYIRNFFADEKRNFYLEIIEFDRELKLENIKKALDAIHVPMLERVAVPHNNNSLDTVTVTEEPVPVGYIHLKRLQQTLLKKNSGSISISKRNPKTGDVIGEDKNARQSDTETFALTVYNANDTLRELMGPRSSDMVDKNIMYNQISKDGYASLEELENNPDNKIALNTFDAYMAAQMLSTNLTSPNEIILSPRVK